MFLVVRTRRWCSAGCKGGTSRRFKQRRLLAPLSYARWSRIYVRQPVLHAFACEAPFRRSRRARQARGLCLCRAPAGRPSLGNTRRHAELSAWKTPTAPLGAVLVYATSGFWMWQKSKPPLHLQRGFGDKAPGDDLLSHGLSHTTIGAAAFHFRVRDGIGWFHSANFTRETVGASPS